VVFLRRRRTLPIRAEDIMVREVVTVTPETPISKAAKVMWENRIGSLVVVSADGRIRGIVTERDMVFACSEGWDLNSRRVIDIMTDNPITVRPGDDIVTVINKMRDTGVRHLPVVDEDGRPIGIISYRDVLDTIMTFFALTLGLQARD